MKREFLIIAGAMLVLSTSCNNSTEPKETKTDTVATVVTDTVTKVVEVPATIDSAAITAEFLAAQKKATKKANPGKPKKQGNKEVNIYSEETLPSIEAIEASAAPTPAKVVVLHSKEYVYYSPAEKAKFPGGQEAFNAYVKKNIVYPEQALKYNVEGTVFAELYLDSLGHVTQVEYPGKHLGSGLEEETTRIMMSSPRWMPAREAGKTVKSKITVPVTYKIRQ